MRNYTSYWYFNRYYKHLPDKGELVIAKRTGKDLYSLFGPNDYIVPWKNEVPYKIIKKCFHGSWRGKEIRVKFYEELYELLVL